MVQGVKLCLHAVEALALSRLLFPGGFNVAGKGVGLLAQVVKLLLQVSQQPALVGFISPRRRVVGGQRLDHLGQLIQLRDLSSLASLRGFIVGGKGRCLLVQFIQLFLYCHEVSALGRFLFLCGFVVGGKRISLSTQVVDHLGELVQLAALGVLRCPRRVKVSGQGVSPLAQAVDLPGHVCYLGVLGGFILVRRRCFHPGFQCAQVVLGGKSVQLACQRVQVRSACVGRVGQCVGLLAQGVEKPLHGGDHFILSAFLDLRH